MKKLDKPIEAIKEELKKPLPPHNPEKEKKMATRKKKGSKKKTSKKVNKKVSKKKGAKKKVAKKAKVEGVTLKALADEAGITGQKARQKLRAAGIERAQGSRWVWPEKSKDLKKVRKALGL